MEVRLGVPINMADRWEIIYGHVKRKCRGAEA